MTNRPMLIFARAAFFVAIFVFLPALSTSAFRAGLDYTCMVFDGGQSKEMTCDMCSHTYSDGRTSFSTYEVSAKEGYVVIVFLLKGTENEIYGAGPPLSTIYTEFEADYFMKIKVREGQKVRLKGTDFGFKLIDAFGLGCPEGVQC